MSPLEQSVYASLHNAMMDVTIQSDRVIHLTPPIETAFERIHSRARPGEEGIQCNLIYKLAELHEAYLSSREDVYQMSDNEDADIEAMLSALVPSNSANRLARKPLCPLLVNIR